MPRFRGRTVVRASFLVATATLLAQPALAQDNQPAAAPAEEQAADAPIVVTGSRLSASGFNAPSPVTVMGADEIARRAAPNVSEVLNQIPAFRAQSTAATSAIFGSNLGAATADLRGLGANRTLVLVDGRRVVASTVQGGSFTPANTVDLNTIPTSLIARTEVVTGGASAAYGSDAVAGVVNLILDTRLKGLRASAQYGQTDEGDAEEYTASLAFGTSFGGDRGRFIIGGEYNENKGTGDCYTRDWCSATFGPVTNPAFAVNGLPASLIVPGVRTATATNNGIITSGPLRGLEFNPDGTTRQHDYGTYYGAGIYQIGGGDERNPFFEHYSMVAPVKRYSGLAHFEYDLTDSITFFAEGSYAKVKASQLGAQVRDLGNITIRRDNAYLSEEVQDLMDANGLATFTFGRIGNDFGPTRMSVDRETYRAVGGFNGELGGTWKWEAYYQYGRTNYHQAVANNRINSNYTRAVDAVFNDDGDVVCRSTLTNPTNGCIALNLFGAGNYDPNAVSYSFGTALQDTHLTQHVAAAQISGEPFSTWAGPVAVALGGEYREDIASGTADPISAALNFYVSGGAAISGKMNVKEGFLEVGVPLARDASFARSLDLNGAIRLTDYSVSGSVTSWKLGATWEPVDQLRLRVTRSRDIRAPNIFELYAPRSTSFQTVTDPENGGAFVLPLSILGGNANLVPEIANTLTIGGVFSPDFAGLNGLQLSVDYYDINLEGAIATYGSQIIVNLCAQGVASMCANVVRDADDAIVSITNVNQNVNNIKTRGLDFELLYRTALGSGDLTLRSLATHVMDLTTVDVTGRGIDRAGQNGAPTSQPSGVPNWQVNTSARYSTGPFSGEVQARYISGGYIDNTKLGPLQEGHTNNNPNSVNLNRIKAYWYFNANAQYDLIRDGDRSVQLFGAVNNIGNRAPPVAPSSFGPTNNVLYDVLGRTYRIGVRVRY